MREGGFGRQKRSRQEDLFSEAEDIYTVQLTLADLETTTTWRFIADFRLLPVSAQAGNYYLVSKYIRGSGSRFQ
jgi:hypothetical protein